ncbi:nuclear transport factor 2 family protein [Marinobacterium sediminicola]|uniref:Steroid delta-isomerase n=1 Tax=Marinobacterium sediminicola TaxID=518898 RepID=A0ABY1S4A6_9GAMM|nr:nuclear transport factor 2 family protein [Marinobacterium sediminicola]ULG70145.1 nuclear transport factor 2 family protein [Marinobacterium sediminicola]SMR78420.1 steroid delta-isomerase [Marinobacterium sediminicola]
MINAEQIHTIMARYLELVSSGDVDAILALYASDAIVEDPVGQPPHIGRHAIDAFYRNGLGEMKVRAELQGPIRATDSGWGAMPFSVTVTNADPVTRIDVIDVMEFDDKGRIKSMKAYWGEQNLTTQPQGD